MLIVDGHNLIPKVRGLSLKLLDDEELLIEQLQTYCRVRRQSMEVFFDQAAPGQAGKHRRGMLNVHFVPAGSTADQAIIARLRKEGKKARNFSVVSSDRRVQSEARALMAKTISSETFAADLESALQEAETPPGEPRPGPVSDQEVEYWLQRFKQRK